MSNEAVTVVMPVYNGSLYIKEAIDSILAQSFVNFILVIIDDGSTDDSLNIINSYQDRRIKVIRNEINLGVNVAMMQGVNIARSQYVVRMDQDDISLPERLAIQVAFMEDHPEIGACGSWIREFGVQSEKIIRYPTEPDAIKCWLLFCSVINNPASIMRRDILTEVGLGWRDPYKHAYDYALWVKLAQKTKLANIPEVLLQYRLHQGQASKKYRQEQLKSTIMIQLMQLGALGIDPDEHEIKTHLLLGLGMFLEEPEFSKKVNDWLLKLKAANDGYGYYPKLAFADILRQKWI